MSITETTKTRTDRNKANTNREANQATQNTPTSTRAEASEVKRPKPELTDTSDKVNVSSEVKAGEAAASNSPVNFGAWDNGASAAKDAAPAANSVGDLGTGTMKKGAKGDNVKALQKMLNEKMGTKLDVDGDFGQKTLDAVKKFQKSQGLDADGVVGKDTRGAFGTGATEAKSGEDTKAEGANPADTVKAAQEGDVSAKDAAAVADQAGQKAASEAAADQPAGDTQAAAEAKPGEEAKATEETQAGEKSEESKVPGTEDTSWTEKLPAGLKKHADAFIEAGKKHGVDPRFLAAISMQETGGGTSKAIKNKNNAMGIMGKKGLKKFKSVADSIDAQARSLTREGGYYKGANSINGIAGIYAPVGAKNDPTGLNRHWKTNVGDFYERLGGDSSDRVKGFT